MPRPFNIPPPLARGFQRCRDAFLRLPLAIKITALVALTLTLCTAILLTASIRANSQVLLETHQRFAQHWVKQIAYQAQHGLLKNDRVALHGVLRFHLQNPLLQHASIVDSENNVLVEAGDKSAETRPYRADIHIGKDIAGAAEITLDTSRLQREIRNLGWQLLVLAGVLTALFSALFYMGGTRLEQLLGSARRQLLRPTDTTSLRYTGADALGELLEVIRQQPPRVSEALEIEADWVVLEVRWQHYRRLSQQWGLRELERRLARSYRGAQAIARLYHGRLRIYRDDGVTLRFAAISDGEPPLFRALCCAYLLIALDTDLGAGAALGMIRKSASPLGLEAAEAALAHSLAGETGSGTLTGRLSGEMNEQLRQWADSDEAGHLTPKEQYRTLLQRQQQRLKTELSPD